MTPEQLAQLFRNKSDCYADTEPESATQAMSESRFVEVVSEALAAEAAALRAELAEAKETVAIVLGSLGWTGDGYEWTGGQYDYRMTPSEAVGMTENLIAGLRRQLAEAKARAERAETIVARLPKTADGVPVICDGMILFCPKGHENKLTHADHHVYCTTGECWDDGCQGDSGSGTGYAFGKCFAAQAAAGGSQ